MYVKYGSHQHASGECHVGIARQGLRSDHGILYAIRETWTITGMLIGANSAALTTSIAALEAAYSLDTGDLYLYEDTGTATAHSLLSADTIGGTRVTQHPSFPTGSGAEYATHRTYVIVVEGDRYTGADLLSFNEQITFTGGGMEWGFLPVLNGTPPRQIFREQTPYKAIQTGHSTHLTRYPVPPGPMWPGAEHVTQRQITYNGPMRTGLGGFVQFIGYGVQWSYTFEDTSGFAGSPHTWGG